MQQAFAWVKENGGLCSLNDYPYQSGDTETAGQCKKCKVWHGFKSAMCGALVLKRVFSVVVPLRWSAARPRLPGLRCAATLPRAWRRLSPSSRSRWPSAPARTGCTSFYPLEPGSAQRNHCCWNLVWSHLQVLQGGDLHWQVRGGAQPWHPGSRIQLQRPGQLLVSRDHPAASLDETGQALTHTSPHVWFLRVVKNSWGTNW